MLYRLFLDLWYDRFEARKRRGAKASNPSLPWTREEVRAILARLAFATRQVGQTACDVDWALAQLADVQEAGLLLERFAGGLLYGIDASGEEHRQIFFRHETFQEYLAAEWIVQTPEAILAVKSASREVWRVVLAYYVELQALPPENALRFIWQMNPWLAGCTDISDEVLQHMFSDAPKAVSRDLEPWLRLYIGMDEYPAQIPHDSLKDWINPSVRYVMRTLKHGSARWQRVEDRLMGFVKRNLSGREWALLYKHNLIITPNALTRNFPNGVSRRLLASCQAADAIVLVARGVLLPGHFGAKTLEWSFKASREDENRLIELGLLEQRKSKRAIPRLRVTPLEFQSRKDELISHASIDDACHWVELGLCEPNEFRERVPFWTNRINASDAVKLVEAKICGTADFGMLNEILWELESAPDILNILRQAGLLGPPSAS